MQTLFVYLFLTISSLLSSAQPTKFKRHQSPMFEIELPVDMRVSKMYSDVSSDYCDYSIRTGDGYPIMELHSLLSSRFSFSTIGEAYQSAIYSSNLNITYKMQSGNYFVISGFNPENGNIVYWKRVLGKQYVSDMRIEYSQRRRDLIEPNIGRIAKSFRSK
jgi:hypothetical protein